MLMSGNSVLEAYPVYRLAKNRNFELERKLCVLSGKVSSWGEIIAVRFNFMISGYHDSRRIISL